MKRSIITKLKAHWLDIIAGSTGSGIGVAVGNDIITGMNMTYKELKLIFLITTVVGVVIASMRYVILDDKSVE